MARRNVRHTVTRIDTAGATPTIRRAPDHVATEEPLEIRVGPAGPAKRSPLAVTMRTPGDDIDLAIGFLLTEGIIGSAEDVYTAQLCAGDDAPNTYNVVDVVLSPGVPAPETDPTRNFYTTSSCGICGKASIDAVRTRSRFDVAADPTVVPAALLADLPDRLRAGQVGFERTGGLHAAGLFTTEGELVCLREDVGRHNAVDKVVGWAVRQRRLPLAGHVLMVSGRASFELTQKATMAGIPVLAAVSAPSSLAIELAAEAGLGLVGFLRGSSMNVYAGEKRIATD
ncbi:formate dehydrogenase accessory sulfurtransferase FdhD [Planosporangium flavigriseum]|uniref:Sulfur carrier protein FdhD n=1 Tax=Planosporangium flavigriseum TaxID=373681 RepID=A0A8J3PMI9_9ACTN|nr:formate dehydrogenase accessory sulfurtransferase FdhD [Planosporangium flavigriseum]NJC64380.1 formate dehydrogenase accessory sulfurtransferase FdhD [Planosporangium flavigriseum]GIG73908.1 sulfurtransferase FdhD [Planosporangium flavigriseum]